MGKVKAIKFTAAGAAGLCFAAALSACGGPTYGTGKTAGEQAMEDFANITKWGSLNTNKNVDYRPRPELVKPTAADLSRPLPPPQEALAKGKDWPESPEERRARLRAEAAANAGNSAYKSPIIQDDVPNQAPYYPSPIDRNAQREYDMPSPQVAKQQDALYRKLKAEQSPAGAAKTRQYLSQPPLEYYQPSPNAPQGDLGKDEDAAPAKKESGRDKGIFGND